MSHQPSRIKVQCLVRDQLAHIKPVEAAFDGQAEFVYDAKWKPADLLTQKPHIILCVNDYPFDVARCLDAARSARIPSLVLQDGILEWRCQYQNPLFGCGGGAPQHQPVLADKIACLGRASARHMAAWGNVDKVEVTGMPRLDYLLERKPRPPRQPGARLLVMTAKNPGFTPEQREIARQSLNDLKDYFGGKSNLEVFWRVSRCLAQELGVTNHLDRVCSVELADLVEQVDAVITTPSTAILEVMLLGRPVAALDYHNVPRFQQTAWTIASPGHIPAVVSELLAPPASKMVFQQACLADGLDCQGPAAYRVRELMSKMVEAAKIQTSGSWQLSANLLGRGPTYQVASLPPLTQLYSGVAVFRPGSMEDLQVRLARAENENGRLKQENNLLRASVGVVPWVRRQVRALCRP